ncbi:DoxX family protein [Gordonia aichiensis]|uniref:DoxX family protein n=1 Tax=Gordonia aichiensis TaxID=36820 RepID=UPI0032647625
MTAVKTGQNLATTIARVILGVIFLAHGCQKFFVNGMDNVAAGFDAMGAPLPTVSAWLAALAETVGGALLIVGLAVPVVSVILILDMIGAILIAHVDAGFWASDGGYELPLALIAGLIAVGFVGHGVLAADTHLLKAATGKDADRATAVE